MFKKIQKYIGKSCNVFNQKITLTNIFNLILFCFISNILIENCIKYIIFLIIILKQPL